MPASTACATPNGKGVVSPQDGGGSKASAEMRVRPPCAAPCRRRRLAAAAALPLPPPPPLPPTAAAAHTQVTFPHDGGVVEIESVWTELEGRIICDLLAGVPTWGSAVRPLCCTTPRRHADRARQLPVLAVKEAVDAQQPLEQLSLHTVDEIPRWGSVAFWWRSRQAKARCSPGCPHGAFCDEHSAYAHPLQCAPDRWRSDPHPQLRIHGAGASAAAHGRIHRRPGRCGALPFTGCTWLPLQERHAKSLAPWALLQMITYLGKRRTRMP